MDTFFRRHFKRKEAGLAASDGEAGPRRQRRPSVAVPTSKARRRSSAGLPSSSLAQRRRSSVQLPGAGLGVGSGGAKTQQGRHGWAGHGGRRPRRRSSTTAPVLNPRFAVSRRKVGKLRTIDAHLLGPSMLLASLIQMAEEDDEQEGEAEGGAGLQVEVRGGAGTWRAFSRSSSLHSEGDDDISACSAGSQSDDSLTSDREEDTPDTPGEASPDPPPATGPSAPPDHVPPAPRPLIRAPRCLRRNSSQFQLGGGSAPPPGDSTPPGCCRASGQRRRRRVSAVSKAGGSWPGRGGPLPGRKTSTYVQGYRGAGALSPAHYDSHLESWTSFLLYVAPPPTITTVDPQLSHLRV